MPSLVYVVEWERASRVVARYDLAKQRLRFAAAGVVAALVGLRGAGHVPGLPIV